MHIFFLTSLSRPSKPPSQLSAIQSAAVVAACAATSTSYGVGIPASGHVGGGIVPPSAPVISTGYSSTWQPGGGGGYYGGMSGGMITQCTSTSPLYYAFDSGSGGSGYLGGCQANFASSISSGNNGTLSTSSLGNCAPGSQPPQTTNPFYVAGVGMGGATCVGTTTALISAWTLGSASTVLNGGNGLVVITPLYN